MSYVKQIRQLVQIVFDETSNSTDPLNETLESPDIQHCLHKFRELDPKYTASHARIILAMATGDERYIAIVPNKTRYSKQGLQLRSNGLILLTRTGYLNAIGASVSKLTTIGSLCISILAFLVSTYAAVRK